MFNLTPDSIRALYTSVSMWQGRRVRHRRGRHWLNVTILAPLLSCPLHQAVAQEDSPQPVSLPTVTVQAQRQDQSSQDVPTSLTAFSGEELRRLHINSNQDLLARVPSLIVNSNNQTRSSETFTLRGQGTTYQASQGTVMYLAETPLLSGFIFSTQGYPGAFLDIDSLQVLKGPQGTLFGRNTNGGAILLAPSRPKNVFEGYIQTQIGNYADRELEGVVNVPVVDNTLLVRGAFRVVHRDGFTANLNGPDLDDKRYWTGRLGVTFRPTDSVENYFMGFNTVQKNRGTGFVVEAANPAVGFGYLQPFVDNQNARGPRTVIGDSDPHDVLRAFGAVNILTVDLSNDVKFRNITSYSVVRHSQRYNLDGFGPLPGISEIATFVNDRGQYQDNLRQETEELQLQGLSLTGDLRYVFGAYLERIRPDGPNQIFSVGRGLGILRRDREYGVSRSSKAIYGQSSYDLGHSTPVLKGIAVTGGLRYTWDKTQGFQDDGVVRVAQPTVERCGSNPSLSRPNCLVTASLSGSAPSWLVGLDYRATPDTLVYTKLSRGYKAGGVNVAAVNLNSLTYAPEYARTLEVGFKSDVRWGGVPLRFNAAVYNTDYANIQRAASDFNPAIAAFGAKTTNAASARIRGLEAEFAVRPLRGLDLAANYSYTDARYKSFQFPTLAQIDCTGAKVGELVPGAPPTADLSCIPFPSIARNQYSVNVRQTIQLSNGAGEAIFGATYAHQSKQYTAWTSVPGIEPGSYLAPVGLLTLTLDWRETPSSPLAVHLFVTNALNKTYSIGNSGVYGSLGFQNSVYGEPRMLGVQLKYSFGGPS